MRYSNIIINKAGGSNMNISCDELAKVFILIIALLFIILTLIRLVFKIILAISLKIYFKNKMANKKSKMAPNSAILKNDEELLRNKNKENGVLFNLDEIQGINKNLKNNMEMLDRMDENNDIEVNNRIVGIVRPVGFWTSLILGDQLGELLNKAKTLSSRSKKGFWISMLETQTKISLKKHSTKLLE